MTLIIAEAGVNHNGSKDLAFELIDSAHAAGADIVKFQTFKAKNLSSKHAKMAKYQVLNSQKDESQFDMLSRLELPYEMHYELVDYCNKLGIEFLKLLYIFELKNLRSYIQKAAIHTNLKFLSTSKMHLL